MTILITAALYFALLLLSARLTERRTDNNAFFRAGNSSPWFMVAFGMIGASISGVTFVSVPGTVNTIGMTYMQTCLGFIAGYAVVAFVLLPVYYRLNLTTIYGFLSRRLGRSAHITGAAFFLLSELTGAAVKFFVVCIILQRYVLSRFAVPFPLTVLCLVFLIWLYTRRGGIRTLVRTDSLQTACMLLALCIIIYKVSAALGLSLREAVSTVCADKRAQWFVFGDPLSKQYFWKQFLSGAFIVIVMTGLNQNIMQKNMTCKSLRAAQKDMCSYGIAFIPVNLLFLFLGVLLSLLCAKDGVALPAGDELLTSFAATGRLGESVTALFTLGIVAASCSTADSALTALTTTVCVDILRDETNETLRRRVHAVMAAAFAAVIIAVGNAGTKSVIDFIYTLCGYTYGPLLGLFAFALLAHRVPRGRYVPVIAVASPLVCFAADCLTTRLFGYRFGYELLMLNGLLTFAGLYAVSRKAPAGQNGRPAPHMLK
ncbi:MAG: sodium:solute symporter [Prevotella sp.]|nr:sodium:solute symporter [Prevotella sp.]